MNYAKLLIYLVFIPAMLNAQEPESMMNYDLKEIEKLLKSTTYVVLDQHSESEYSLAISESAKKYWKITPIEVIDRATYREYIKDKTKSFLTRDYVAGNKDYITLNLFMGGQKQMDSKGRIIATVRLKHYTEADQDFVYKMSTFVQNIQWQVQMINNQKYTSEIDFQNLYKSQGHMALHARNLYILNEHLTNKIENLDQLKKHYKHDVTLVSKEQIAEAIKTEDSTIAFLSIVAPIKNPGSDPGYFRIYRADNGESLISYERFINSTAPLGVTGFDLKTMNK